MTQIDVLTWVASLALAVSLAAAAGLRAWLPLLVTGVLGRAGVINLGDAFAFLTSLPALAALGLATLLEIGADKVPTLDHALDAISTVVRPAAGALLAASVMFEIKDPLWAMGLGLVVGAPAAALPHAAKSVLRLASTGTTAGLANPLISVLEDATAVLLIAVGVVVPIVAALGVAVVAFLVFRRVARPGVAVPSSS